MSSLDRRILRLAFPSILAALSAPLIGLADTAMIGHLPAVSFLGAVSTASLIFSALYWSAGFLRMGTTAMVAQYFGAGDEKACAHMLYRALLIALALGLVLLAAGGRLAAHGFALAGGSAEVQSWGARYVQVRICEAPLVLALLAFNGFFLGAANPLAVLVVTTVANLVNVGADYALIYGHWGAPALGVVGAAWASVLGNAAALLVALGLFGCRYGDYWRQPLQGLWARRPFALIFRANASLLGRTLCLQLAQFVLLAIVSRLGEVPLAAHAVVWQLWGLSSFAVDGFAHAAETLVGNALGARRFALARSLAARTVVWGLGVGAAFALFFALALDPLARLFSHHGEVVEVVVGLRWIIALVQPLNAAVFVFDGIFIGANDMAYLFAAMVAAVFAAFAPAVLLFAYGLHWGIEGAWLAYDGLMVGRFLSLWPRYRGDAWLRSFAR